MTRLRGEVVPLSRAEIDLPNPRQFPPALRRPKRDLLINCAAYNFVDKAETEPAVAFANNAIGVRHLALACAVNGTKLVQISSDFVVGLDESRSTPLTESVPAGPVSTYGNQQTCGRTIHACNPSRQSRCPNLWLVRRLGFGGKGR